jgi:hypothetical protein
MLKNEGKRWSGFEWADQQKDIMLIGAGGIGSWTALSLSRILHNLYIIDGDTIDETNVQGGQLFRKSDIGSKKVMAVTSICEQFGCENKIYPVDAMYTPEVGMTDICITGLDNMAARKLCFESWLDYVKAKKENGQDTSGCIFIDGRMAGELCEVFAVQFKEEQIKEYSENWLFTDEEVEEIECTLKQTTFMAMGIGSFITSTVCNFLYNNKLGAEIREVPFHQRFFSPILDHKTWQK